MWYFLIFSIGSCVTIGSTRLERDVIYALSACRGAGQNVIRNNKTAEALVVLSCKHFTKTKGIYLKFEVLEFLVISLEDFAPRECRSRSYCKASIVTPSV